MALFYADFYEICINLSLKYTNVVTKVDLRNAVLLASKINSKSQILK